MSCIMVEKWTLPDLSTFVCTPSFLLVSKEAFVPSFVFVCILILKQWTCQLALFYGSQLLHKCHDILRPGAVTQHGRTFKRRRIKLWIHNEQVYVSYRPKLMLYSYWFPVTSSSMTLLPFFGPWSPRSPSSNFLSSLLLPSSSVYWENLRRPSQQHPSIYF